MVINELIMVDKNNKRVLRQVIKHLGHGGDHQKLWQTIMAKSSDGAKRLLPQTEPFFETQEIRYVPTKMTMMIPGIINIELLMPSWYGPFGSLNSTILTTGE